MSKGKPQGANILSFFTRTPGPKPLGSETGGKRRRSAVDEDVKPVVGRDRSSKTVNGKALGVEENPVVISDSDDDVTVSPSLRAAGKKRHRASSSVKHSAGSVSTTGAPTAFPSFLDFKPPSTWPEIVNTASNPYELDQAEDELPSVIPPETPPVPSRSNSMTVSTILGADEWDEGDDEGMGMDDGDDYRGEDPDEGDDVSEIVPVEPPKRILSTGDKAPTCPICGKSMKGKGSALIQQHVNACLDSPCSAAAASAFATAASPTNPPSTSNTTRARSSTPRATKSITSITHKLPSSSPEPEPEPPSTTKGPNAFSVLMSGHKENEEWKTAEVDLKRDGTRSVGRRLAPFYKVMTGMPIAVDAFRYGAIPKVKAYLLTHAHSDHYTNLSKSWKHGPIYCSITTANLIKHMLGVEEKWVHGLPEDVPIELPDTGGVTVTVLEANHCPGSSLFLFEGRQTVHAGDSTGFQSPYVGSKRVWRYLHCGDFRACPKIVMHPAVACRKIDVCYLDTTYLNPQYCFPPQPLVIAACATLARKTAVGVSPEAPPIPSQQQDGIEVDPEGANEQSKKLMQGWLVKKEADVKVEIGESEALKESSVKGKGRTLVVIGTYSIGKERIVKGVAKALGSKIYCDARKRDILFCEADPDLHAMLTDDPFEAQVHVVPLGNIQLDRLQPYLHRLQSHFDRVLGFRPTGWTYTPPAGTNTLPDVNTVIKRDQSRTFTDASLKPMRGSSLKYMMFGVPYSEHSSFFELTCFALSLPGPNLRMIATVNVGNEKSRGKMKKWFEKWASEKAKREAAGLPAVVEYRDPNYW